MQQHIGKIHYKINECIPEEVEKLFWGSIYITSFLIIVRDRIIEWNSAIETHVRCMHRFHYKISSCISSDHRTPSLSLNMFNFTIEWKEKNWITRRKWGGGGKNWKMNIQMLQSSHYHHSRPLVQSCGDIETLLIKKYLQCRSSTKLISLASTSGVFIAWQVNIEFKSDLCTWGHINRFSVKSPVCCSTCSSTISPFTSHRTCGVGRPVINRNENCYWLESIGKLENSSMKFH